MQTHKNLSLWFAGLGLAILAGCQAPKPAQPAPAPAAPVAPAPVATEQPAPPTLNQALDKLLAELLDRLAAQGGFPDARVAVVPFPDASGRETDPSKALAERLTTRLAGRPGLTVLERGRLEYLLKETAFQVSSLADPGTAVAVGRALGANVLLTGSYSVSGKTCAILARLVSVESHEILAAAEVEAAWERWSAPAASPLVEQLSKRLGLDLAVLGERRVQGRWEALHVEDGTELRAGDHFQIHATPTQDCELYVLLAGASGRVARIYPDRDRTASVSAGQTVQVPAPGPRPWFALDATPGTETLVVVAWLRDCAPEGLGELLASVARWDEPAQGQAVLASLSELEAKVAEAVAFRNRVAAARSTMQVFKREVPPQDYATSAGGTVRVQPDALDGTGVVVKTLRIAHR